jgi:pimeloyl-ACP methyl ester carboxylesterase
MEGKNVTVTDGYITMHDGVRLFFQQTGNREKTLLILNGFFLFNDFKYLADDRTVIGIDLRNRGRSDYITDDAKLNRGIHQDVDDIEAIRRHCGADNIDLLSHSYAGIIPILYAAKYPAKVGRIVQISSMQPNQSTQYPPHLTNADAVLQRFFASLGQLQQEQQALTPEEFCGKFWTLLRTLYVVNPDDADKIEHWKSCHLPTELNFMSYWMRSLMPSIQSLNFSSEDLPKVQGPVLAVHGTKDRSAPYGGGREWALILPNARLLTIEDVAHAPWIEAPDKVLSPIKTFLNGAWPEAAERVESL